MRTLNSAELSAVSAGSFGSKLGAFFLDAFNPKIISEFQQTVAENPAISPKQSAIAGVGFALLGVVVVLLNEFCFKRKA